MLAHPGVDRSLDARALADLLTFGFVLGEKTLCRGIACLAGGSRLTFDPTTAHLTLDRTTDFRREISRQASGGKGLNALLEDAVEAFQASVAVRSREADTIGVSLSGGYDSRTIMAAVDHRRCHVQSLTLDVSGGADQAIAQRIAKLTNGLENHRFVCNSDAFFSKWPAYVREMTHLTDGMYYDEACVMMPTLDAYRDMGVGVVLRGHGGELARMHEAYELRCSRHLLKCTTQEGLKSELFRRMTVGCRGEELTNLLTPDLGLGAVEAARASLDEAFSGIDPKWHVVDQISCIYVQEYLRRQCVPSLAQLRSRVEVRLPYLDREYVCRVLRLPPTMRLTTQTHNHILRRCRPELLRVMNANTGIHAGAPMAVQQLSRRWWKFARDHLGYERFAHYVDPPAWLRGPLRSAVSDVLLDRRTLSRGIFQPGSLRRLLEEHTSGRTDHSAILLIALGVELWQRYVEAECGSSPIAPASASGSLLDLANSGDHPLLRSTIN